MKMFIQNNNLLGTSLEVPKRNNKGVSLVALVIMIIIIIILAAIGLNAYFTITETQATKTKALNEFIEIENAVFQRGQEHKLDSEVYPLLGYELSDEAPLQVNNKKYGKNYYMLEQADLFELGVN
jgi:type II secretory pathway pseudopilin PulG